ncbi:MAG: capsule assembly Wzi family protein, partial [Cytophagaceae bacterium]|nr:capsule assembly Wzi family protein [Cytophagaceae bacterium]
GGFLSSTSATPFWLQANQSGISPLTSPAGTLRAGFFKDYPHDSLVTARRKAQWGAGISTVVNAGATTQLLLPEAYLKVKYGRFELYAGRRRELIGLGDSTLSSGFIINSGNALPIPKIQLATLGYVPLLFKGFFAFNAGFAHGWFNVPYIQGAFLHQKYLYFRLGKPTHTVRLYAGINHQVQWGGHADFLLDKPGVALDGKLPSTLRYFPYVVTGLVPRNWNDFGFTANDSYAVGNHLGSYDAALEVSVQQSVFLLYHQHIYEDKSSILFINAPDGLSGLSWSRTPKKNTPPMFRVQRVVVEYLNTMYQSGDTFYRPNSNFQGTDNYFNHNQYQEGWSYFGRAIGTPFIEPTPGGFPNNRVSVWYVGAGGIVFRTVNWTARTSYSYNYGTYGTAFESPRRQFSSVLNAQILLPRWHGTALTASVAYDRGDLYPATVGTYLGLKKSW